MSIVVCMVRNIDRRNALADAGLGILAEQGARGLTHRAIDTRAAVPIGTASNYFRNRDALIAGMVERIGERLAPTPEFLAAHEGRKPSRELFTEYLTDIAARLLANREVTIALFELRLESLRRPEIAAMLQEWRYAGFEGDVEFNRAAGLPGDRRDIALFHYAIEGLLFDRITGPLMPEESIEDIVYEFAARLLLPESS